jgi:hypothetical protein
MGYTLKAKIVTAQLVLLVAITNTNAQFDTLSKPDSLFFQEVMLDAYRLEGYQIIYKGMYNGSVQTIITEPRYYLTLLDTLNKIKYDEDIDGAIKELMKNDTLIGTKKYLQEGFYYIAPTENRIYKWKNKSEKRFLRKFFNDELVLVKNLKFEDRLALVVILWEKRVPFRQTGYGSYIVTSKHLNIVNEDIDP